MDKRVILFFTELDLKLPEDPNDTAGKVSFLKWEIGFNAIFEKKLTREENCQNIFNLYLQHSTLDRRSKLKSTNGWTSAEVTHDGIAMMKIIRSISNKHNKSKQVVMEIFQSDKRMFLT